MCNLRMPKTTITIVLATTLSSMGCIKTLQEGVTTTPPPSEDNAYADALKQASQNRKLIKNFETRYDVTATYLSPEFRNAFAERLKRVFNHQQFQLEEASSKAGFFVILHTANPELMDLSNPNHWTVQLDTGSGPRRPILVKKLRDKERWSAFFDSINIWTNEYLVVFDAPSVTPGTEELVEAPQLSLMLANPDGKVTMFW